MATFLLTTGDDTFTGTASDDVFDGYPNGATGGIDKLDGGAGNDLFQIGTGSSGTIDGGAGIDTVELYGTSLGTTTYTRIEILSLPSSSSGISGSIAQFKSFSSIEHADETLVVRLNGARGTLDFAKLLGAGQLVDVTGAGMSEGCTITGTSNADRLIGTIYSDVINGGAGNDLISGYEGGNDILNGGDGNDHIYSQGPGVVDGGNGSDHIYLTEFSGSASGGSGDDTFHLDFFPGGSFTIDGGIGRNKLLIYSSLGDGTFSNIETMTTKEDVVVGNIDQINSFKHIENTLPYGQEIIFSLDGAGGILDLSSRLAPDIAANISNHGMLSGYTIIGTSNADAMDGTKFADVLNGGAGDDYINGSGGGDILNGGGGNDEIHAQSSSTVDAGNGHDTMYLDSFKGSAAGGSGNDIFHLQSLAGGPFQIDGGTGYDRLFAYGNLGEGTFSSVENIHLYYSYIESSIEQLNRFSRITGTLYHQLEFGLSGSGGVLDLSARLGSNPNSVHVYDSGMSGGYTVTSGANDDRLDGTGYADVLNGGAGYDRIHGGDGNDLLNGGSGIDQLFGGDGDDRLIGGTGVDEMSGGTGNDTYYVDAVGDVIIEAVGEGTADRVATSVSYALTAGAEIELLQTSSAAGTGPLNLYGNEFAQTLIGNAGNNRLDGRGGADTMRGLAGNDTYIVDDAGDVVIEATGQGTDDRVIASVSYKLSSAANIERMQTADAAGTDAINFTGNNLKQSLSGNAGDNVLDGRGGADTMNGGSGNDTYYVDNSGDLIVEGAGKGVDKVFAATSYTLAAGVEVEQMQTIGSTATNAIHLTGNSFAQTLIGNAGNNRLDGGGGADTMNGLFGDDTYIVDNAGDVVIEAAGRGTDKVIASVSHALSANAEVEIMQTNGVALTTKIDLTGSNTGQSIFGNNGANRLDGKYGIDTLRGYGGADTFVFSSKITSGNVDTVVDFNVAQDTIELESDIFTGLTEGAFLSKCQFVANTTGLATTVDHRIIYETDTGNLYFDTNGSAAGGRVLFGVVATNLALTSDDFFVG